MDQLGIDEPINFGKTEGLPMAKCFRGTEGFGECKKKIKRIAGEICYELISSVLKRRGFIFDIFSREPLI
jgi:hypothetical protein